MSAARQILFDGSDVAGEPTELFYIVAPLLNQGAYSAPLAGELNLDWSEDDITNNFRIIFIFIWNHKSYIYLYIYMQQYRVEFLET